MSVIESSHTTSAESRRLRTAFTANQLSVLKTELAKDSALCRWRRKELSDSLGLPERTIKIWFQNRRQDKKKNRNAYAGELTPKYLSDFKTTDESSNDESIKCVKSPCQSEHSQDEIETPASHQPAHAWQQATIPQYQTQREADNFHQDRQHFSCYQQTPQQQISQQQLQQQSSPQRNNYQFEAVPQPVEDFGYEFNTDFCQKFMAEADYFRSLDAYAAALFSELTTSFTKEDYDDLDIYLCYPVI